jgi:predicted RNA binding protein YcfA (HicA-like mRNA interferase family)
MKRRDLVKKFLDNGWWEIRDTGGHTIFTNGKASELVAHHTEISEELAKKIIKRRGLK